MGGTKASMAVVDNYKSLSLLLLQIVCAAEVQSICAAEVQSICAAEVQIVCAAEI
jgi:hypothetical protein